MGTLRIVSKSEQPFHDRQEAGRLLGQELAGLRGQDVVVLGIPRGGVVIAREVAEALQAGLDVVLARKLRTPGHAELAMGSVSENGRMFLNEEVVQELGISSEYIENERATQVAEISRRSEMIRRIKPREALKGRVVIVTDDGVATGATTMVAIWAARQERPEKLIAAFPVGPEDTMRKLAEQADEVVCLRSPPLFMAVGQFYTRFQPIEDEDVLQLLREEQRKKVAG